MRKRSARTWAGWTLVWALAIANLAAAGGALADSCDSDVGVNPNGDTCGRVVAVSGTGNASGSDCEDQVVGCIAVSGTGNASNTSASCGGADGNRSVTCVAVSGDGNASNSTSGSCGGGAGAVSVSCVAVSGTGDATNSMNGSCGGGNGAVTVTCIAVTGGIAHASNEGATSCNAGQLGANVGCVAVSGLGSASNNGNANCAPSATAPSIGCISFGGGDVRPQGCIVFTLKETSNLSCEYGASRAGDIAAFGSWVVEVWHTGACGSGTPDERFASADGDNNVLGVAGLFTGAIDAGSCARATVLAGPSAVHIGSPFGLP